MHVLHPHIPAVGKICHSVEVSRILICYPEVLCVVCLDFYEQDC